MNLIELFDTLTLPEGSENMFNAATIPEFQNCRVAVNCEGYPVILLSVIDTSKNIGLKNFRLKYLQFEQNIECKVSENSKSSFQTFTVITFTSPDRSLQEYFLRISETLIKTISAKPTPNQVIESLNKFVEVFRSLTDTPTNTVHGLWTELFLIDNSVRPSILLNYWHSRPEEKFDFNSDLEKIEVKSNSNFERIHTFSSEQLNPPNGTKVIIASIFVRQSNLGQSIQQLAGRIMTKIQNDIILEEKLYNIICKTLGNSLEQSIRIKFDYDIARSSLLFYQCDDISKIDLVHIPTQVSEVKYKSDLSTVKSIDTMLLKTKGVLFNSI